MGKSNDTMYRIRINWVNRPETVHHTFTRIERDRFIDKMEEDARAADDIGMLIVDRINTVTGDADQVFDRPIG